MEEKTKYGIVDYLLDNHNTVINIWTEDKDTIINLVRSTYATTDDACIWISDEALANEAAQQVSGVYVGDQPIVKDDFIYKYNLYKVVSGKA